MKNFLIILILTVPFFIFGQNYPDYSRGTKLPTLEKLILEKIQEMRVSNNLKPLKISKEKQGETSSYAYDLSHLFRLSIQMEPSKIVSILSNQKSLVWPDGISNGGVRLVIGKKYSPGDKMNEENLSAFFFQNTFADSYKILDSEKNNITISTFTSKVFDIPGWSGIVISTVIYIW